MKWGKKWATRIFIPGHWIANKISSWWPNINPNTPHLSHNQCDVLPFVDGSNIWLPLTYTHTRWQSYEWMSIWETEKSSTMVLISECGSRNGLRVKHVEQQGEGVKIKEEQRGNSGWSAESKTKEGWRGEEEEEGRGRSFIESFMGRHGASVPSISINPPRPIHPHTISSIPFPTPAPANTSVPF